MENSNSSQQSAISGQQIGGSIADHLYGLVDGYLVNEPGNLREVMRRDAVDLVAPLGAEIERLRGIIARNAMQRLDGSRLYITPADIDAGIEIAAAYRKAGQ